MTLWKWSQTAASNATADSSINFRERQAPGSVNDAARALMAAVAKYRDDLSGNLVTTGTSTAYTLTTNQGLTSLTDGFVVVARIHVASGASPTLDVDSLGAKQIERVYGSNIEEGYLLAGGICAFVYDGTADSWIVHNGVNAISASPDLAAIEALSGTTGALRKTAANTWALDDGTTDIVIARYDGGEDITSGVLADVHVPFACTITGAYAFADQTGSAVIDLWKDSYANFPPTDADSITASAPITISSGVKTANTTLTGWTTSLDAGDIIRANIDSISSITRLTVAIRVKRFI